MFSLIYKKKKGHQGRRKLTVGMRKQLLACIQPIAEYTCFPES